MASNKRKRVEVEVDPEVPPKIDLEMAKLESRARVSPQPKLLFALVTDGSFSMRQSGALALALKAAPRIITQLAADPTTKYGVEVLVIVYDDKITPLRQLGPLKKGEVWQIAVDPHNIGGGMTHTGAAARYAFRALREREAELCELGITVRAQVVVILTDGFANDPGEYEVAIAERVELDKRRGFKIFGVGVGEDVDWELLGRLCPAPLKLADLESFDKFWNWVYQLSRVVSETTPGQAIEVPSPLAGGNNPAGFAEHWGKIAAPEA
jgi:uncharacterized protein YegL